MAKVSSEDSIVYKKTAFIVGFVLLIFCFWLWWARVYSSKSNVFNAMLSNSLSMFGVTKNSSQKQYTGKLVQTSQLQLRSRNIVNQRTDINQTTEQGEVSVTTQTVSTPSEDFARYTSINMPVADGKPKVDFSSLINEWGSTSKAEGGGSTFSEMVFGIVPFGNLPHDKKAKLLEIMHSKSVYKTDFSKAQVKNENGRAVYVYDVEINVKSYAELLKTYGKMLGLKQMDQLNPEDYATAEPIKATLTVDKLSRTLVRVVSSGDKRDESFNGFGVHNSIDIPENTISRKELEIKLQNLLSGTQ